MTENKNKRLSEETKKLLRSYFDAFSNLYGITPLYRALRIIQKQNSELELTEEEFLSFVNEVDQEEHIYTIAGAEDIYSDVDQPTPPLKREIIAEYLFAADDFESYDKLKTEQDGKPFYIPQRESLLKYQDDCYDEETKESIVLGAFLRDKLKLKKADDVLSDLQIVARTGDDDPQMIIWTVERLARVDLAILRLAAYELMLGELPAGIVINEAVELANQYSTDKAGPFINGVLGNLSRAAAE